MQAEVQLPQQGEPGTRQREAQKPGRPYAQCPRSRAWSVFHSDDTSPEPPRILGRGQEWPIPREGLGPDRLFAPLSVASERPPRL